jgi:sterol 24-C-methyltransferase
MAADFHNPISRAIRPEDMADTLSRYRRSQGRGKEDYARMVEGYYDLSTDFYEYGWGQSFHFAPGKDGASLAESIAAHQHLLGNALGLQTGMKVLDVGCGVGGPQRELASRFGASITGLNINEYQIGKCSEYNRKAGLGHLCSVLHGDFMAIPAEPRTFDAAYHIEALAHAPNKMAAYAEVFRVLRPGAIFAGFEWCMTPLYDGANPEHRALKQRIEYSNALPEIASFTDVTDGLQAAGFEVIEARDRALDDDVEQPWYRPLEVGALTLRGMPRTALGRKITAAALRVLEHLRAVPKGSYEIQELLNVAADSLVAAGRLGIFTPMYFHKACRPGRPRRPERA